TARVPYGTKSGTVVQRYAINCANFLVNQGAKIVVIACNTATAHALEAVQQSLSIPVIGVIEPGAKLAAATTRTGRVGVIGTDGTIASGSYQAAILAINPEIAVLGAPCPLFVPLAEEGMTTHPATRLIAEEYLKPLLAQDIDTLVLGCTHYPILQSLLQDVAGSAITIINSAAAVAQVVAQNLEMHEQNTITRNSVDRFFATDVNQRIQRVGESFLGAPMGKVELVDL
ncbi:glutamate racemase, partial [Myxococcota bacterium]|nr:glutamate racemase [Myxococcota bacterium]